MHPLVVAAEDTVRALLNNIAGRFTIEMNQPKSAFKHLLRATFNLGNAYYAQGRNQEAVNIYKNALERDSSHAWAAFNAGEVSGALVNTAEAYVNLSRVLLKKGESDEAAQMYQQAKSLGVSDPMLEGVFFPSSILQQP